MDGKVERRPTMGGGGGGGGGLPKDGGDGLGKIQKMVSQLEVKRGEVNCPKSRMNSRPETLLIKIQENQEKKGKEEIFPDQTVSWQCQALHQHKYPSDHLTTMVNF